MHVVIFGLGDLYGIGGVQVSYQDLLGALVAAGHTATFFSDRKERPGQPYAYAFPPSVAIHHYRLQFTCEAVDRVRRLAEAEDPDVVLVVHSSQQALPILTALHDGPYPVILSERGGDEHCITHNWFSKRQRQIGHLMADRSHLLFPAYARSLPKWMDPQVVAIPELTHPSAIGFARPEAPGPDGRFRVVYAGRLTFEKDVDVLLRAFARVADAHPDWDLHVYGDGGDRPALEALAAALGPPGEEPGRRVLFHGALERDELFRRYLDANVFVLPSRAEGCPLALREAMAHGVPGLGFATSSGVNAVIADGRDGVLAPGGDKPATLADALGRLMADGAVRARMGRAAVAGMEVFAPRRILDAWLALLGDAARLKGAREGGRARRRRAGGGDCEALEAEAAELRALPSPRNAFFFDPSLLYNDALAADPLHYAVLFGSRMFDAVAYGRANPDVKLRGLNPLAHYLLEGALQGRPAGPLADPDAYAARFMAPGDATPPLVHLVLGDAPAAEAFGEDAALAEALEVDRRHAARLAAAWGPDGDPDALRAVLRRARTWTRVRPEDVEGLPRRPPAALLPSASVIIPAFNAQATIVEAVTSAVLQTHPDLEVVVVDDGSTDGTAALLGRLAAVVPRLTWFTQGNGGLSAARNAGLDRATGEFVLFHDADDVLHRGAVAALAQAARDAGADVVAGVFRIVEERSATPVRAFMARERIADFKADAAAAMRHCTNLSLCNKLLRREHLLAGGLRFRDGLSMQDVELWLRMMFDLRGFVQTPVVVADYVQAANSNSRQRRPARFESVFRLFDLVDEHYEARGWAEHRLFAHCAILQGAVGFFLRWKLEDAGGRETPDLLRLQALLRRIPPEHFCHYHARKNAGAGGLAAVLAREGRFAAAAALMADPSRHKRYERGLIPTFAALLAHAEALVVPTVAA